MLVIGSGQRFGRFRVSVQKFAMVSLAEVGGAPSCPVGRSGLEGQ